jgi:Holliday junction resolvasome RuvABC endonuclease subunit
MALSSLRKRRVSRCMGIDASTNSLAFCIVEGDDVVKWGEIFFHGADVFDRLNDARAKTEALVDEFDIEYVCVEAAVMVNNIGVAIKLAYIYGSIIGELMKRGATVVTAKPLEWQNFIGNGYLTKAEKQAIADEFPGKSKTWYSARGRDFRKQRTLDYFNTKYGLELKSDNVGDALGLAYYASHKLTEHK